MQRLFADHLYSAQGPKVDEGGRIRVDELEMQKDIQDAVAAIWPHVTTENLAELTDIEGYRTEFLKLFGFGLSGIDPEKDVEPHVEMPAN